MTITITIACDNAAFSDCPELEVARILNNLSQQLANNGIDRIACIDANGNKVGSLEVTD